MADNVDLERFDYDSGLPIFICANCYTHFASPPGDCTTNLFKRTILLPEIQCRNLVIRPPGHQFLHCNGTTWHARLYCRQCYSEMGYQIVREDNPNRTDQVGMIGLYMSMMLLWNGHDLFALAQCLPKEPPPLPHQNAEPPLYLCRDCNTQFASNNELSKIDFKVPRIFFESSMNLVVDPLGRHIPHMNGTTWVAIVRCSGCNKIRGMSIVREDNPDDVEREGFVGLDMTLLNIWNGSGREVFSLMRRLPMLKDLPQVPSDSSTTSTPSYTSSSSEMPLTGSSSSVEMQESLTGSPISAEMQLSLNGSSSSVNMQQ
ncbi:uncharacterized protein LOC123221947 [Mangifera indica]|uniref:uncharacterized protein LOC123221947 n=1 Tax=Mangifera indica TaxID=29780 RepID=UPI001CF965E2|nr:uncharacterized protein LOC123221947 [Mangifera indica]